MSSGPVIVGLDAGTSMIKAVAFTPDGQELASVGRRNEHDTGSGGAATQDMERCWQACAASLRALADRVPGLAERIVALGVTGQGDGCWLIDSAGDPVGPGWLWLDSRAAETVATLTGTDAAAAHFQATGTALTACQQGPQLLWMRANAPQVLDRAATAFHCKDFLYFRMTGIRATDPCEASFSFGNFRTRSYDETAISALGLQPLRPLLPPILDGSRTTHPLTDAAARATGLPAGTPVALGFLDAACTALAAGVFEGGTGHGCTIIGSTGVHMRASAASAVTLGATPTGYVLVLPVAGQVARMQTNMSGTLNIDWILGLAADLLAELGMPEQDLIARLDDWLDPRTGGSGAPEPLYQPYISAAGERGPFVDPAARAGLVGLSTAHRFPDLVRAVVTGLGFAARDCYTAMGGVPTEIRLTGGAARSTTLRARMGAALGTTLRPSSRDEAGAAGAAMIAATATGAFGDMESCIARWVTPRLGAPEPPDPDAAAICDRQFDHYRATRLALAPVWASMAAGTHGPDRSTS